MTSLVDEEVHSGAVERVLLRVCVTGLYGRHPRRRQRRRRRLGGLATGRRRRPSSTGAEGLGMAVLCVHNDPCTPVTVFI